VTAPCGTRSAYRRHLRHGEQPCHDCQAAESRRYGPGRAYEAATLIPDTRERRTGLPEFVPYVYGATLRGRP
jgi:hypothetical protein